MTDKEIIRKEIERWMGLCPEHGSVLGKLCDFIDSMQEEPVSEDLEKAAIKYAQDKYMPVQTSQAFKAGAKWQRQQMKTYGFEIININRRTLEYIYDVCKGVMPSKELFIKCVMRTIKED